MKTYKLLVHKKNYRALNEDFVINPKEFPNLKKGDFVEIFHPEDDFSRLILQINDFRDDLQGKVSVEQSIANTFQLRPYKDVFINIVDPKVVALDSVEITFKDQYMGRSEMWRLKNCLVNTAVYVNKKLELCGGCVRCQVYEMWAGGERMACGVLTENTKVAFRSLTSMVYLFVQMSSEMWDFDIHGDLYLEKALNGFLEELFQKWKKHSSNHEVTIVLFSRTFYKASSVEEFPIHMRECLQHDYQGRFYEDFYRVAVQNERYEDWSHILVDLRKMLSDYQHHVLEYHGKPDSNIPKAFNSTAAEGNFLEVLNMSLNVFDKHYLDRSFDRTGQLSIVITPGVGVFHVDRELTNVTKQRVIDMGVCSDLVCLGEQPLHAVPLLKFHNKDSSLNCDDYCMPHWLNLSFYSSNKMWSCRGFIPRIKLPPRQNGKTFGGKAIGTGHISVKSHQCSPRSPTSVVSSDDSFSTIVDFNNYDAKVFTLPTAQIVKFGRGAKKTSVSALETGVSCRANNELKRKLSDPDLHYWGGSESTSPSNIYTPTRGFSNLSSKLASPIIDARDSPVSMTRAVGVVTSCGNLSSPMRCNMLELRRALINPFDPSHISIKLTSNRRRWAHIFPKGPTGLLMQQHHYQASPTNVANSARTASKIDQQGRKQRPSLLPLGNVTNFTSSRKSTILLWGATGEQEWTPSLTTGVDWKSLTVPACLPITTDYFPDIVCLLKDYEFSEYMLLPEDINADQNRVVPRPTLTTRQVFNELVSQRLAQSFQIVVDDSEAVPGLPVAGLGAVQSSGVRESPFGKPLIEEQVKLSIGRLFHKITLCGSEIRVTRYRPRHPYPPFSFHYRYRFKAPDHDTYCISWVSFTTEKLENYPWNFIDNYICTRGDPDFPLQEKHKFWRFRTYLLPLNLTSSKKILDGAEHCDIYTWQTLDEQALLSMNFLRFMEVIVNKVKRAPNQKKQRLDLSSFNVPSQLNHRRYSTGIINQSNMMQSNSPFRERLGSNRLPDKPRPRSGSKVLDRGRMSPAMESSQAVNNSSNDQDEDPEVVGGLMLKEGCSYSEILEGMKNPIHGLTFILQQPSLPSNCFTSSDALTWIRTHIDPSPSYLQGFNILSGMLSEKLICHASGSFNQELIIGFHLYYIVRMKDDPKDFIEPIFDLDGFQSEWAEVEIEQPKEISTDPNFLSSVSPNQCQRSPRKGLAYKECYLEIDSSSKSDRVEWGHCKYDALYKSDRAYEMVVKWFAASGTIVTELMLCWARKAQNYGLQVIPIPADPFALPYSLQSDPLRGPVFIPLDIECLMGTRSYLFQDYAEPTWSIRLSLFQESIAMRFGFISTSSDSNLHQHKQYIHLSGNVFLLIPVSVCDLQSNCVNCSAGVDKVDGNTLSSRLNVAPTPNGLTAARRRATTINQYHHQQDDNALPTSLHHEYITRHVTSHTLHPVSHDNRVGFLWCWNHMVSRRWRQGTHSPMCDEAFQNKLLRDFKEFCSNCDNRLKNYWDQSHEKIKSNHEFK